MANKVRKQTDPKRVMRAARKSRIRKKIVLQRGLIARLVVFRSNRFLYAQVIDDAKGTTYVQANTKEKEFGTPKSRKNIEAAKALGALIGRRAKDKGVERVLFDRNGYDYHGRVKALADGAREAGLDF